MTEHLCLHCQKSITGKGAYKKKFCSLKCVGLARKNHYEVTCANPKCGKVFHTNRDGRKYCSRACTKGMRYDPTDSHSCQREGCKNIVIRRQAETSSHYKKHKFCSQACARKANSANMRNIWSVRLAGKRNAPPAETVEQYLARGGKITKVPAAYVGPLGQNWIQPSAKIRAA